MRSDLAVGIGSKQTPQSYEDGHSATQVSGKKSFDPSDRFNAEDFQFRALNRVGDELTFKLDHSLGAGQCREKLTDIPDLFRNHSKLYELDLQILRDAFFGNLTKVL